MKKTILTIALSILLLAFTVTAIGQVDITSITTAPQTQARSQALPSTFKTPKQEQPFPLLPSKAQNLPALEAESSPHQQ